MAFTRQYAHQAESTYLILANVGFGAAQDVHARVVRGAEDNALHGSRPVEEWVPLKRPISVLRVNERLWTILRATATREPLDLGPEVCIEITYSDMEGTTFGPERFTLDWFPNDGANFGRLRRTRGKEVVEDRALHPEDL